MAALTSWARRDPYIAEQVALNAVRTIVLLAPSKSSERERNEQGGEIKDIDTAQYGIITVFLCHVILWVFASVSPSDRKKLLLAAIERDSDLRMSRFMPVVRRGLGLDVEARKGGDEREDPKILFRSAAEMLTRLGTWGASLNLALLVHKRSEM